MKAMIFTKYGDPDVLHETELDKPEPKKDELLVKVHTSTVNIGDVMARRKVTLNNFNMPILLYPIVKLMFGLRKPKKGVQILGSEFAGVVDSVGNEVDQFSPGDRVFGYRADKFGSHAEFMRIPEKSLVTKMGDNYDFKDVVHITYGTLTSFILLNERVKEGKKVLIIGASGSIGSYGVQIAKNLGAEVTGVCSTEKVEFVKSIGADHVIDYKIEDFTKNGQKYDIIFDILGKNSFGKMKKSLNKDGRYLLASFSTKKIFQMLIGKLLRRSRRVVCALAMDRPEDILKVKELFESGTIKSIIDKEYSFDQIPEAHDYVEKGHKKGGIIINVTQ